MLTIKGMLKEGINKRAQEGVTLTTLLLIILGAVVVVVVILGFTTGFGFVTDLFAVGPSNIEAAVQACDISARNDLKTDYCRDIKEVEIDGLDQHVTCNYLGSELNLLDNTLNCEGSSPNYADYCINSGLDGDVRVDGVTCDNHDFNTGSSNFDDSDF